MENYVAVKARLLEQTDEARPRRASASTIPMPPRSTRGCRRSGGAEAVPVSVGKVLGRGIFAVDGALYDALGLARAQSDGPVDRHASSRRAQLAERGARLCRDEALREGHALDRRARSRAFPGLAHRIEDVGRIGKVRFINDSKATNADAAARALVCFPDIFWIAGGKPKDGGIESLAPYFPRIRKAYLIGEAAQRIRAHAGRPRAVRDVRDARSGGRQRRGRCAACLRLGARRAAVAGLRVVRPVPRFRSSAAMPSARWSAQLSRPAREGGVMRCRARTKAASPPGGGRSIVWRFSAMLALIAIGLMLAFAASPAATGGPLTAGDFRYAAKQIAFAGVAR